MIDPSGTTSTVIFTGELMKQSELCIDEDFMLRLWLSCSSYDDSRPPDTLPLLNLTLFYPFEELQNLNLSRNNFQGWFDESQGDKGLSFSFYNSSDLPFLNQAVSLKTLILRNNFIEGGFPVQELINLTSLEVLDLKFNEFSGPLPGQGSFNTNLRNLKALDLSNNHFSGSLQKSGICKKTETN